MVGVSVGLGVAVGNGVGVTLGTPNDVTIMDVFGYAGSPMYSALSMCAPGGAHVVSSPFASEENVAPVPDFKCPSMYQYIFPVCSGTPFL